MKGYLIEYRPYDGKNRTLLHHALFGRLVYRNFRGRKTAYYIQGMLHNTKFYRLLDSKIFVFDVSSIDVEELSLFGTIYIDGVERDISPEAMQTAEEHWKHTATERNGVLRVRRRYKDGTRVKN